MREAAHGLLLLAVFLAVSSLYLSYVLLCSRSASKSAENRAKTQVHIAPLHHQQQLFGFAGVRESHFALAAAAATKQRRRAVQAPTATLYQCALFTYCEPTSTRFGLPHFLPVITCTDFIPAQPGDGPESRLVST